MSALTAVHFKRNPGLFPVLCNAWQASQTTDSLGAVTCKRCLAKAARLGLRPRILFPDVPTFEVRPARCGQVKFTCPVCGKTNYHGRGNGHRLAHCGCWELGYILDGADRG